MMKSYKDWLAKFIEVDLPIGDLARETTQDDNFPETIDYTVIKEYAENWDDARLRALETSWRFFQETSLRGIRDYLELPAKDKLKPFSSDD